MKIIAMLGLFCLGSAAHAACDTQTYMPVGTRTYQMTGGGNRSILNTKTTLLSGNRLNVQSTVDGKTTTTIWTCTDSGLRASLPAGEGNVQVTFDTGFLPDTRKWKVGYSWKSTGKMTATAATGGMSMNTSTTGKIVKQEKITTPAGTFTALRVDSTTTARISLPAGTKLPPGMDLDKMMGDASTTTAWYVKGVGMVKTSSADNSFSMVLTKIGK